MIGNDVVDLNCAAFQSDWRRKGYLEKVFTTGEQEIIASSGDQGTAVWLLWSMKEAAYKAHQRQFSLPRRLNWKIQQGEISHLSERKASGVVRIENQVYFTNSCISSEAIHTSAVRDENTEVKTRLFHQDLTTTKNSLLREIAAGYSVDPDSLELKNNEEGIPVIALNGEVFHSFFSLSDHGRFSAFSFALTNS